MSDVHLAHELSVDIGCEFKSKVSFRLAFGKLPDGLDRKVCEVVQLLLGGRLKTFNNESCHRSYVSLLELVSHLLDTL